jgi:hypothetical protein
LKGTSDSLALSGQSVMKEKAASAIRALIGRMIITM